MTENWLKEIYNRDATVSMRVVCGMAEKLPKNNHGVLLSEITNNMVAMMARALWR